MLAKINTAITFVFYLIFLTVPLAMWPTTNELFEFNKMWLLFGYSSIIFLLWGSKMIVEKRFQIRRTPFDIPLAIFLISQIVSTLVSMDIHTSFWGYYTRFNGGLLSTIVYIFLYYAFATNILSIDKDESVKRTSRMVFASFISCVLVALWGLPSRFGYDPTCLMFRGSLDVACWTAAFQPKIRMFSTLGQPNWLAAFMTIALPLSTAYAMLSTKKVKGELSYIPPFGKVIFFALSAILFYLCLLWTLSQSGFIAFWIANIIFIVIYKLLLFKKSSFSPKAVYSSRPFQVLISLNVIFILLTFLNTNSVGVINKFTLPTLLENSKAKTQPPVTTQVTEPEIAQPALESSITNSGDIRKIVWQGAIDIWKEKPLFGSGVETFAYAYYQHRPQAHNLTSEWDYLYNKAHNEFLNYLSTTGAFGLGSYLLFIGWFIVYTARYFLTQWKRKLTGSPLLIALFAAFIAIQISNFFGFSVVIINFIMFMIPLFFYALTKPTKPQLFPTYENEITNSKELSTGQIIGVIGLGAITIYFLLFLLNFWRADQAYALGYNYQAINEYPLANENLERAVEMRKGEDLYKNELSVNLATIALLYAQQQDATSAGMFAERAKILSDEVSERNPNNVVFSKTRTRVLYSLAQLNPEILPLALETIEKASQLAPTDAKILYNKALLYDQAGEREKAIAIIDETIKLKPNYRDAYYAKALFYSEMADAIAKTDPKKAQEYNTNARENLEFILSNIIPNDGPSTELLKTVE